MHKWSSKECFMYVLIVLVKDHLLWSLYTKNAITLIYNILNVCLYNQYEYVYISIGDNNI